MNRLEKKWKRQTNMKTLTITANSEYPHLVDFLTVQDRTILASSSIYAAKRTGFDYQSMILPYHCMFPNAIKIKQIRIV